MSYAYSFSSTHIANNLDKYAALMFDKNMYLFKQSDIHSFESLIDVQLDDNNSCLGVINVSGRDVPVHCLDDDLAIMKDVPATRSVCVIFKSLTCAILCRDIRVLEYENIMEMELPECMRSQYMPISKICIYKTISGSDDRHAMLVSGDALEQYIVVSSKY